MRVLITGGAGFIGQHLARRLAGHEVSAIDSLLDQVHPDPLGSTRQFPGRVVIGDVIEDATWAEIGPVDAIVHLAAETGTGQSMYEQDRYRRTNVEGTRTVIRWAARWDAPVVFVSSRAVYGEGRYGCPAHGVVFGRRCCAEADPRPSSESDPHRPVSYYGWTKSAAEGMLRSSSTVPVSVVRPQNVVGPGQSLHNPYTGVLAAFLARLREGRPLEVYGDGSATRDIIHVGDLARQLEWLVEHPGPREVVRVVNAGSGVRTTLLELAEYAVRAAGVPAVDIRCVDKWRPGDIAHACADLSRARRLGVPLPTATAAEAVADFIAWGWERPGAPSSSWDEALAELHRHRC